MEHPNLTTRSEQTPPAAVTRPQQIGSREILTLILRRRWIILGTAVPIILLATIGTLRTTENVTASVRVLIEPREPETPTFSYTGNVDYTVLMSSAAQVAMSIPVAEQAAASLIDSMPTFVATDPTLAAVASPADLRDLLLSGVEGSQVGESNILSIEYRHPNARFALMAVGALMNAYMGYNVSSQKNTRAIDYYTEQISVAQAEIDSLMQMRATIRAEAGYAALQANAQSGVQQIMSLEESLFKARATRTGLETRLDGLLSAIEADPDYVPASRAQENQNLVGLKSRVDELQAELAELRVQYQDDSEWVRRQRELIAAARTQLHKDRDNFVRAIRIDLEESRKSELTYEQAVEQQKSRLVGFPNVERQVETIDLQVAEQRDLLKALQLKRGEVRLKAGSDMRISGIIPLNAPSINTMLGRGKKALYLFLASVFAVALGFISAIFVENQDHRLHGRQQAEQMLELPVLAAISMPRDANRGT